MSEESRETFNIPDIGEFRAKKGTSTAELAGAASFWCGRAKAAEAALFKRQWGYFSGGVVLSVVVISLTVLLKGFLQ